ncbi:HTH-type transcriptional regulator McbR [Baekduia alba]|nr:HTH-type transcriptional regulator McbR [Baekduia alba]
MTRRSPVHPLQNVSLVDQVVGTLRDRIDNGELEPGAVLRIDELARELGVSRTPVREAISALEAQGVVVRRTNYPPTVFTPSRSEVLECYEMRTVLEPLAASFALPNLADEALDHLEALVSAMDQVGSPNFFALNREFHEGLYQAADRPFLLETIDGLIRRSDPYIRIYFKTHDLEETQRGHRRILDSLRRRDDAELQSAIVDHLQGVVNGMLDVIDGDGPE